MEDVLSMNTISTQTTNCKSVLVDIEGKWITITSMVFVPKTTTQAMSVVPTDSFTKIITLLDISITNGFGLKNLKRK